MCAASEIAWIGEVAATCGGLSGESKMAMSALPCPTADPFAAADQAYATITGFLHSKEAWQVKHSELERQLEGMGRELMRKLLQAHLDMRQPGQAVEPVRDAAGTPLAPTPVHGRSLESIFGTVEVARTGYGAAGTPSLHPLDGALNLPPEKYSLEVRRRVAMEAAKISFDEGVKTLEAYTGAHVPKRQFEELAIRAAQDFEAFYQERQTRARAGPHTGSILVLTVDGKGVAMLPEDLREPTQRAAEARTKTFTARLGSGRRVHAKRMASVAAIYTIEPFVRTPEEILPESPTLQETESARPRPEHKRVWASLAQAQEAVIREMFEEAARRDPKGQKRWVALVDGNLPQIDRLQQLAEERNIPLILIVDFIHVAQYVWKAAGAFFPGQELEQDGWTRGRLLEILRGKASLVAAGMRRSATLRKMAAAERKPVDECADYLLHYSPYLQYDKALAEGFPIATGVIEGACRHLVEDRMNLTGARWSLTGAEAVLRLRSLRSSNDFDAYWKFHEQQEYERNHASHYANHRVPETVPPSAVFLSQPGRRSTLKIVKKKAEP
jgi:hypothetical protein